MLDSATKTSYVEGNDQQRDPVKPVSTTPTELASTEESYSPPEIVWEEHLEETGVFAACSKDSLGELGQQCLTDPFGAAS